MKRIILVALLTTGCSSFDFGLDKAAEINDEALKAAEFTVCHGASIGSIRRRFNTPELAELWQKMCVEQQGFKP